MKHKTSVIILTMAMLLLAISLFISNRMRSSSVRRDTNIATAKANFSKQLNDKNASIDSVYAKDDTILYYKKGAYMGMTVTVTR